MTNLPVQAILFDFDGTLVESMDVKIAAFRDLYAPFGDTIADAAVAHYRAHSGVPRSTRIRACHEMLLGRKPNDKEIRLLGDQFGAMVEDKVIAAPLVAGAEAFLEAYADRVPLLIVSATPQEELERIIERRGMMHYFVDILGSPPDKLVLIHDVLSTHWWAPDRVLMVGDGRADEDAAMANGCRFLGRLPPGESSPFSVGTQAIPDLASLPGFIPEFTDQRTF